MSTQIKDILLRFDEIGRYETPSRFDYKGLSKRVLGLVDDLQKHFGLVFQIDSHVQDASFFCDIRIPHALVIAPQQSIGYSIRISNYGGLATINFQEEYSEEVVSAVKSKLSEHEFVYIGFDDLDQDYDGQFEEFKNISGEEKPTWFVRYFDYL